MAGRMIAQIIVSGVTMFTKAFFSAYQQALRNAKAGGAPAATAAMGKVKFKMRPDEALRILNIEKPELTKELLNQRYKVMFANNDPAKGGSFYLQSKIFRSKEVLEKEVLGITDEPAGSEEAKPEGAADSATEGNKEKEESNTKRSA